MTDRDRFDVLDGLRGVAASMVLLGHTGALIGGVENMLVVRKELAVVFFFMLSGFVIAAAYQKRVRDGLSKKQFLLKRVIRLYPLVLLGVVLGAIWFATHAHDFAVSPWWPLPILTSALVLPSPHVSYTFGRFPLNPPEWSLFMEMVAYIFFALAFAKMTTRSLSFLTTIAFAVYTIIDFKYFGKDTPFPLAIFQALAAFCGGILLWRLRESGRFPKINVPSWVLAVSIVAICITPNRFGASFDIVFSLIIFPLILMLGATHRRTASPVERWLGELSYPLYMLHWTMILAAQYYVLPAYGVFGAEAVSVICAITVAWLAFVLFDRPARRWLTQKFAGVPELVTANEYQDAFAVENDAYADG